MQGFPPSDDDNEPPKDDGKGKGNIIIVDESTAIAERMEHWPYTLIIVSGSNPNVGNIIEELLL